MNKQSLPTKENEECRNENCKKTIQILKNKLRLKAGMLKKLQDSIKAHDKNVTKEILDKYEELIDFKLEAEKNSTRLLNENMMLGQVIEKLKEQTQNENKDTEEYSIDELKKTILDITEELEKYKIAHKNNQDELNDYKKEIKISRNIIEEYKSKLL